MIRVLAASSSRADIGDTLDQSFDRYGKPRVIDQDQSHVIWDNGRVTCVAIFDGSGHCDMMEIYGARALSELEIATYLSFNMVGPNLYSPTIKGRYLAHRRFKIGQWLTTI